VTARTLAALTALALLAPPARADEKSAALEKQKAAAQANWKKMEFEKPAPMVETTHFLLFAQTPEARSRALGSGMDRMYAVMLKALDYKGDDRPWPGKLPVYVFSDRTEFVTFMRKVVKKSPKEDESSHFAFKAEDSLLVVGMPRTGSVDADLEAKHQLAAAILERKMGAGEPPDWVSQGFADASIYRAANPTSKGKGRWTMPNAPVMEIWGEKLSPKARQDYAAYIIDYLAYGPLADQFSNFVGALRPDENGNTPSVDAAFKAINVDATTLQNYARAWTKPKAAPTKPKKP
jgi:hypothetical protein